MLHLILGTDWTANRDEILRRVSNDVRSGQEGRILMVPELISHDTERRLCEQAGPTASRFAEVLSFTRLARRVSDSVGSAAPACLDNGGRLVAMAAAARGLAGTLKVYGALETRPEFLIRVVATPPIILAPSVLQATRLPAEIRVWASRFVVVDLPFVPEIKYTLE